MEPAKRDLLHHLKRSYVGLFCLRHLACLLLCAYCVTLTRSPNKQPGRRLAVVAWLARLGSNFRSVPAGGVFAHAYQLYLTIYQLASHLWLSRRLLHMDLNHFHAFMSDSVGGHKMAAASLDEYIKEAASSNLNYARYLVRARANRQQPNKLATGELESQLALLGRQHRHLVGLLQSSEAKTAHLWTSSQEWRSKLSKLSLACQQLYTLFIWLCWTSAMLIAHHYAHQKLLAEQQPAGWLDTFARTEQLMFAFAIIDWFVYEMALVIVHFAHQLESLRQLNLEFGLILNRMAAAARHEAANLDERALELYLRYRLFVGQLQPCLLLTGFSISHYLGIILPLTITVASVTWAMEAVEALVSFYAAILVMLTVHVIVGLGAHLNAKCMHLAKRIWSLQALGASRRRLVSAHTIQLWSRINHDQHQVRNRCSCKLFNSICVDYTSIIRLDFWIVSLVILVLTNR